MNQIIVIKYADGHESKLNANDLVFTPSTNSPVESITIRPANADELYCHRRSVCPQAATPVHRGDGDSLPVEPDQDEHWERSSEMTADPKNLKGKLRQSDVSQELTDMHHMKSIDLPKELEFVTPPQVTQDPQGRWTVSATVRAKPDERDTPRNESDAVAD